MDDNEYMEKLKPKRRIKVLTWLFDWVELEELDVIYYNDYGRFAYRGDKSIPFIDYKIIEPYDKR